MSKKIKGSSKKSKPAPKAKKSVKPLKAASKKSAPKKSVPAKKAKPVNKKSVKPAKKADKKKVIKKEIKKPLVKASISKSSVKKAESKTKAAPSTNGKANGISKDKKSTTIIKNPVYLKKDDAPIPEFKPIIQPTVKTAAKSSKDAFPASLKSTSTVSLLSKKTEAYSVKVEKEPPGKFELEFVIRASAELLYEFLTSPSGLSEWFCDDVNIRNGIYTFIWDGQLQQARLLKTIEEQLVRYQWVDKTDGSYFEFRIQRDELTNDISLIITDFASDKGEQESAKLLWGSQIDKLLHVMGSFF